MRGANHVTFFAWFMYPSPRHDANTVVVSGSPFNLNMIPNTSFKSRRHAILRTHPHPGQAAVVCTPANAARPAAAAATYAQGVNRPSRTRETSSEQSAMNVSTNGCARARTYVTTPLERAQRKAHQTKTNSSTNWGQKSHVVGIIVAGASPQQKVQSTIHHSPTYKAGTH